MHFFQALILGIIEGITEFLPISSTGHLILVSSILHVAQTDFAKSFEIIIQLGSILSVVVLYWRKFLNIAVLKKVFVAFLPTAVIGLVLYKFLKQYLLGNNQVVLWALLLGGIIIIAFEATHKEKIDVTEEITKITYKQAVAIGLFQSIAIIPGVSRSAATILGGMLMNIKRRTIVEFSFLLAVPTMAAASALDLLKSYKQILSGSVGLLGLGFIVSFVVAIISIKYFMKYIQTHSFRSFGVYRIVVAIIFWMFV